MAWEAGKGSRPRPFSVSQEEYGNRWEAIFGRDNKESKTSDSPIQETPEQPDNTKPE